MRQVSFPSTQKLKMAMHLCAGIWPLYALHWFPLLPSNSNTACWTLVHWKVLCPGFFHPDAYLKHPTQQSNSLSFTGQPLRRNLSPATDLLEKQARRDREDSFQETAYSWNHHVPFDWQMLWVVIRFPWVQLESTLPCELDLSPSTDPRSSLQILLKIFFFNYNRGSLCLKMLHGSKGSCIKENWIYLFSASETFMILMKENTSDFLTGALREPCSAFCPVLLSFHCSKQKICRVFFPCCHRGERIGILSFKQWLNLAYK